MQTTPPGSRRELLLSLALDLTASLTAADRYRRLVDTVRRTLPCDAVALLRLEQDELVPLAAHGLLPDALGRRFALADHPRLDLVCRGTEPTLFPAQSELPDPYDGLVEGVPHLNHRVHSCLGLPLRVGEELVGVLTLDALEPGAFDDVPTKDLSFLAALAGATLRTGALIAALELAAQHQGIVARDLVRDVLERRGGHLVGRSASMERLREEIELFARSDFPVLVTGETGVGKELVVRMLHAQSTRAEGPLVYVNCAALPESIAESELFGHEKGAFTGATDTRPGKFQVADEATLFLDEVGELPLHVQPKLLRALQEGEIQRVGSDRIRHVDVRVLAATNRDLEAEVESGRFRADLLHRLDVGRLRVPPLREHPEDVPQLVGHICDRMRRRLGTGPVRVAPAALAALNAAPWPGNVRELENVVSRGVLRASSRAPAGQPLFVLAEDLDLRDHAQVEPPGAQGARTPPEPAQPRPLREAVEDYKRTLVRAALERHDGNWAAAARSLGLHRGNLHHLARRLGLRE